MYKIVCYDSVIRKRHVMTFEVKASVFEYAFLFFGSTAHGSYRITENGETLRFLCW